MPDPNVLKALEEIKLVLQKHDLAGMVLACSKTHTHYLRQLDPTWSCVRLRNDGQVRFRCKREDFASKEEQSECARASIGMLMGFLDAMRSDLENLEKLLVMVGEKIQFEHMTKEDPHEPRS